MMRAVCGSTVLYPCDANQTAQLVAEMADLEGISYLRTTRAEDAGHLRARRGLPDRRAAACCAPPRTTTSRSWAPGSRCTRRSPRPTRSRARASPRACIDCYSVKPIDAEGLREAAAATGAVVTVEDHWPEGGLGDAVLSALADLDEHPAVARLAVAGMPGSGTPAELLAAAGIARGHIAEAARRLVRARALP